MLYFQKTSFKQHLKAILLLSCSLGIFSSFNLGVVAEEEEVPAFFSISILAPVTCPSRDIWAALMVEQFPKIGIVIDVYDATGWVNIAPRTWAYPGPYPIPPYNEGGFDLLFMGWSYGLDWNPCGLFDSSSIIPNGDNFYQYSNPEMDLAISNYNRSYRFEDQLYWGKEIQKILYEDLPQIALHYHSALAVYRADFEGWDPILWENDRCTMENWSIPGQAIFRYALPDKPSDFYVYDFTSIFEDKILAQIYPGLLHRSTLAEHHRYVPYIAQDYTTTDGLTYHFWLNPDVRWADGEPLNASDVAYSFEVYSNLTSSQLVWQHSLLSNLSITILTEYELEITLPEQSLYADSLFALPLIPQHLWNPIPYVNQSAQANNWSISEPNKIFGAGPYYLEEFNSSTGTVHLKQNEYFSNWSSISPHFTDVYFIFYNYQESALAALTSGKIDMIDSNYYSNLNQVPEGCAYSIVGDGYVKEIAFNNLHPFLGTGERCPIASPKSAQHIRRAISYLAPRETYIKEVLEGMGEPGVTHCSSVASVFDDSLKPFPYDLEQAKEEMCLAGFDFPTSSHPSYVIGFNLPFFMSLFSLIAVTKVMFKKHSSLESNS